MPKLLQAKIVQSFENAKQLKSVSKPIDQLDAEYRLELSIRGFQIAQGQTPTALVELPARLVSGKGEVKDARIFKVTEPAEGDAGRAGRRRAQQGVRQGRERTGGVDRRRDLACTCCAWR